MHKIESVPLETGLLKGIIVNPLLDYKESLTGF